MSVDRNYMLSNSLVLPSPTNKSALSRAKTLYHYCRERSEIKQGDLQNLSDDILIMFGLTTIPVKFAGKQPSNKRGKTLGVHRTERVTAQTSIQIYKFTAKQKKVRASKSAVETLLHELIHELDIALIQLTDSIHSAGFYKRISQLKDLLNA